MFCVVVEGTVLAKTPQNITFALRFTLVQGKAHNRAAGPPEEGGCGVREGS